jgi:hypothetical protein
MYFNGKRCYKRKGKKKGKNPSSKLNGKYLLGVMFQLALLGSTFLHSKRFRRHTAGVKEIDCSRFCSGRINFTYVP